MNNMQQKCSVLTTVTGLILRNDFPRMEEQMLLRTTSSHHGTVLCNLVTLALLKYSFENVRSLIQVVNNYQVKPKMYGFTFKTSGQPANHV